MWCDVLRQVHTQPIFKHKRLIRLLYAQSLARSIASTHLVIVVVVAAVRIWMICTLLTFKTSISAPWWRCDHEISKTLTRFPSFSFILGAAIPSWTICEHINFVTSENIYTLFIRRYKICVSMPLLPCYCCPFHLLVNRDCKYSFCLCPKMLSTLQS